MTFAIETNQLCKQYGSLTAVDHLSLRVKEGEIYAFLGLNGAGKTTTIRMLLGMIRPTAGSASVLGMPALPGNIHPWEKVGYLVETPHAYFDLSVRENLEISRRLHPGTSSGDIDRVVERLSLGTYIEKKAGNLSLGNVQRLGLAKALLHHPKLLLLDEPANGLDPAGIVEIREMLREVTREQGVTVFMSSHILGEVNRLADRIGIIHQGRLVEELDVAEMEKRRRRVLEVRTRDLVRGLDLLKAAGWLDVHAAGDLIEVHDPAAIREPEAVAAALVNGGQAPSRLVVIEEDLEDYFLRLVGVNGGGKND
jgi:ABC-2 type transport system ATP-binding protein